MTTNDKPLTRNYHSDREKSEIDSDIRILNIRQRLAAHSGRRNCILQKSYYELSVSIDSLLCLLISWSFERIILTS